MPSASIPLHSSIPPSLKHLPMLNHPSFFKLKKNPKNKPTKNQPQIRQQPPSLQKILSPVITSNTYDCYNRKKNVPPLSHQRAGCARRGGFRCCSPHPASTACSTGANWGGGGFLFFFFPQFLFLLFKNKKRRCCCSDRRQRLGDSWRQVEAWRDALPAFPPQRSPLSYKKTLIRAIFPPHYPSNGPSIPFPGPGGCQGIPRDGHVARRGAAAGEAAPARAWGMPRCG